MKLGKIEAMISKPKKVEEWVPLMRESKWG